MMFERCRIKNSFRCEHFFHDPSGSHGILSHYIDMPVPKARAFHQPSFQSLLSLPVQTIQAFIMCLAGDQPKAQGRWKIDLIFSNLVASPEIKLKLSEDPSWPEA